MNKSVAEEAYDAIQLAGGIGEPGPVKRAHFKKGGVPIIDGQYTGAWGEGSYWKSLIKPGRSFAGLCRRGRTTPDKYFISSDIPVAWGVITAMNGQNTVELATDPLRGVEATSFTIDPDAEFFYLGLPVSRSEVLQPGNLIQVYEARPQTILINDGMDHLPAE